MDSYDHLYHECPRDYLRRARDLGLAADWNSWLGLPPGERALAELLLDLYEEPGGCRVALGDLTRRQKLRLRVAYTGLERPSDREADATFIRHIRQLNTLRESIWEERRHTLDPAARRWSKTSPKGRSGLSSTEVRLAECMQTTTWPSDRYSKSREGSSADSQTQQQLAPQTSSAKHWSGSQRDRILAEGTQLISIYTEGSFTQADPALHIPDRAGWGYIVVRQSETLCQMNNYLMLDPANDRYHGATHKSNNNGEVTAIGEALSWILQQPPDPAISYEICSNSYYGIDAVDVLPGRDSSRIRNGARVQWAYDQLALSREAGNLVQFRKVKAHHTDNSTAAEEIAKQTNLPTMADLWTWRTLGVHQTHWELWKWRQRNQSSTPWTGTRFPHPQPDLAMTTGPL
eukprot:gene36570-biopygen10208